MRWVLLEFDLKKGEKLFGLHFRFFLKSVFQLGNSWFRKECFTE
ncbi:hypothetical protein LEP1GSC112_0351 [Leptospira interrogans serovar Pomona str. UT364]|nr:hypothetical protein LEP1GSC112_0351 [Leptospira interrogans serovar Pomona str. UT364]